MTGLFDLIPDIFITHPYMIEEGTSGALAECGSDKSQILSATIWLTDMDTFGDMNKAWEAWASKGNTPARATVLSARLAAPEFKVEIGVIAAKP